MYGDVMQRKTICICIDKYKTVSTIMSQNVEGCSAKTHKTECRDGNMQAGHIMRRLHKQPQPYIIVYAWYHSVGYAIRLLGTT